MQDLLVGVIVFACFCYAVNALMPSSLRRAAAARLARWPHWPAPVAQRLQVAARVSSGCGCDGCDVPAKAKAQAAAGKPQPIRIHRS